MAPRKTGRPKGRSIDWGEVERLYVQGDVGEDGRRTFPSYGELAGRFRLSRGVVAFRGADFDWTAKREEFQRTLRAETDRKLVETISDQVAEVGTLGARVAQKALRAIDQVLERGYPDGRPGEPPKGEDGKPTVRPEAVEFDRLASGFKRLVEGVAIVKTSLLGSGTQPTGDAGVSGAEGGKAEEVLSEPAADLATKAILEGNQAPAAACPGSDEG